MLSPGSTSVEYAEKSMYPYLLRTVGSDKLQFEAFARLAQHFGWRRLVALLQQSAYGMLQLSELEASVLKQGLVLWGRIMGKTDTCASFCETPAPTHTRLGLFMLCAAAAL
jgi:hypothetical protein